MSGAPPAWAYVDMRDERPRTVDRSAAVTVSAAPSTASSSARSPSSSKPPSMASPNDFEFVRELGSGSWSTVMEGVQVLTGKRYALKILSKAQLLKLKKVKYATIEKDTLAKLSGGHPGVIRMHAAFQDETSLYFVLDLADNGDLADLVKKYGSLSLPCARWYTAQIVDTVLWMHSQGVLHRDLKPENVLLDSELRPKITDFGSAYLAPNHDLSPRPSSFVGSATYVSPELLNRASKTTSNSSDMWAIGCTLYFLVAGIPAFAAINDYQSFRKIEALNYTFPEGFYETAKEFVQRLLVLDPSERLGIEPKSSPAELRVHPFFTTTTTDGNPAGTAIKWDTLWTDPPIPPETGIVKPAPRHAAEDSDDVWESMVQDFSLANIRSPGPLDVDPLSPNEAPAHAPVDVPPDAGLSEVVETVSPEGDRGEPAAAPVAVEACDDSTLKAKDWSHILEPRETPCRVAEAKTLLRKGLLKQNRACILLLTSLPRILCVIVDGKDGVPGLSDVKYSFLLPRRDVEANGTASKKTSKNELIGCRTTDTARQLLLQTGDKEYTFDFVQQDIAGEWADRVRSMIEHR
ncbi:kinase-like domain-containing protein [Lenzites betulinus]|nr:kinase-like domain-containing protein [Lenzites betulinus]